MTITARIRRLREAIGRGAHRIAQIRRNNRRRRELIRRLRHEHGATVMFDSIDLGQVPPNAPAVAGYTGGKWPTAHELPTRFPHAKHLSIAISAAEDADCLDVETGDATPTQAPAWVKRQLARGLTRPAIYTSVSGMDSLLALLAAAGVKRSQVRVFTAHYTFSPHLCGPHSCGALHSTTADATQWTDTALGRNLDQSLLARGFF